jgi:hypothetical protein
VMIALILSLALSAAAQAKPNPAPEGPRLRPFNSEEGRFHISLPETPKVQTFSLETPEGKAEVHLFLVELSPSEAYCVVCTDYPSTSTLDPEKLLNSTRDSQIAAVRGKLLDSRSNPYQEDHHEYPGQSYEYEFEIADGTKLIGQTRLFLLEKRLYQVGAVGVGPLDREQIASKILYSFKLNPKVKPISKTKAKAQARKHQSQREEDAALKALREDAELTAKIDKLRHEQSAALKKLREEIEKTKIPKDDRQAIWTKARAALDRAIWEAYHLFDPQTEYRKKADYLEKKQAEYLAAVITEAKITKEDLELIRQEGILDSWEVLPYPSCDVKEVARKLKVEVRGLETEYVYHRPTCLILIKALENPDAKEVRMTLYKALLNKEVQPCPSCLP